MKPHHALPQNALKRIMATVILHMVAHRLICVHNLLNLSLHVHADLLHLKALGLTLLGEPVHRCWSSTFPEAHLAAR